MEKIKEALESNTWKTVDEDEDMISFYTEKWSYSITKRPIFGYRVTISSLDSVKREDYIFKTENELLDYIKSNKPNWQNQVYKYNI